MVGRGIGVGSKDHVHLAAVEFHVVSPHVVCEGVQRAARGQIEPGVMPVTGQQTVLDRASMEREPHVRAAVVDRVGLAVAPQDADRVGSDLSGQSPGRPKFVQISDHRSMHVAPPGHEATVTANPRNQGCPGPRVQALHSRGEQSQNGAFGAGRADGVGSLL